MWSWPCAAWPKTEAVTCSRLSVSCRCRRKTGSAVERHGDIFDARRRAAGALHAVQRRHESLGQAPIQLEVGLVLGDVGGGGEAGFVLGQLDHFVQLRLQLVAAVGMMLDEQHRLGFAGNQQLVADVGFAGEVQVPAVHQVAGRRLEPGDFQRGVGGFVEAVEQQEHAAAVRRQRIDRERGLGDQRERAFAADQQLRQVELAVRRARRRAGSRCDSRGSAGGDRRCSRVALDQTGD